MPRAGAAIALLVLSLACRTKAPPAGVQGGALQFQGGLIDYELFVPSVAAQGNALPTLLLIHGSGGTGAAILPFWQSLAETNGIVLVAPTLALTAAQETTLPQLFPALLDAASAGLKLDARRTYVFGYSAGGYFAFDAATLLSTRFAAATVFAGIIAPEYDSIVSEAQRKTPIAIYIGDHDQFFSLDQTRRTRDLLTNHGFPVHYVEIAGQDHDYGRVSAQVNQDAWDFMSKTVH